MGRTRSARIMDVPVSHPFVCMETGVGAGGNKDFFVDTGIDYPDDGLGGAVYLCEESARTLLKELTSQLKEWDDNHPVLSHVNTSFDPAPQRGAPEQPDLDDPDVELNQEGFAFVPTVLQSRANDEKDIDPNDFTRDVLGHNDPTTPELANFLKDMEETEKARKQVKEKMLKDSDLGLTFNK